MARGAFNAPQQSVNPLSEQQLSTGVGIRDTTKEDQARIQAADNAKTNATLNVIGATANLVQQGAGLANNIMETRAVNQITEELQSVRSELQGSSDTPNVDNAFMGKEALQNPDFRETLKDMKKVSALERTGRVNRTQTIERLNEIVASAKSRNPAFANSIEAAARDTLGFSPQQKFAAELLAKTPQEQALEQLQVKAARLGVGVEDVQTMELSAQQLAIQKQRFELLKVKGQYDGNLLAQETRAGTALAYTQIADQLAAQIQAGGIQDPVQTKAFIQQQFGAQRARLLSNMPSNVDASLVNANITTLTNEENRLLGMVDNGSIFKFMEQQKQMIVATAEQDLLQLPVLGKIYATMGAQAGAEIMSTISKFKDNPAALQAVFATGGKGSAELNLGFILEGTEGAMEVISGQRPAANAQEQRVASWLGVKQLQNAVTQDPVTGKQGGIAPQQVVKLVDVVKDAGLDISIASLGDPRVVRTVTATKEAHPQVINQVESYTSTLTQEFQNLLSTGQISSQQLEVVDGRIVDKGVESQAALSVGGVEQQGLAFTVPFSSAQTINRSAGYAKWLTKANRLIKMAETYKGTGVVPAATYTDANSLLKTITTGIKEDGKSVPTPPTVIRWGLDEDGNPIRITD